jgi:dienelactone hydrolase
MTGMRNWRSIGSWWRRTWSETRPAREARRGAMWAAFVTVIWAIVVGALNLKLGYGVWANFLFACGVAALGIPLVTVAVALILTILRKLPRLAAGFVVGAFLFLVALFWFDSLGYWTAGALLLIECTLGAAIATVLAAGWRGAARNKRVVSIAIGVLALAANVWLVRFLRSDGIDEELLRLEKKTAGAKPPPLAAPDPSAPGPFGVKTLFYGSGTDLRRPEYGNSVAIRTGTRDASAFFKDFTGWKPFLRRRYWGFGMDKLPLNGRVWYPDGAGRFPLVLIVHGNHEMTEFSDPGYRYLGELLASRGFIVASIDENFFNLGYFHDVPKQQAARGWLLLEHLRIWREWNSTGGNPFYGKVDVENVALIGHSRGGEAVATAALFNRLSFYPDDATIRFHYGFPIKSVIAIAPVDGQYKPAGQWRVMEDVNYFTLQGANDADMSSFEGSRQWDHIRFTGAGSYFKSELYVYRANHGQFNTVWGRTDAAAPRNWFLNLRPLLTGDEQRRIAKVYLSAFLEATLHNRREYVPLFEDYRRARQWLPDTLYVNRYLDSSNTVIANFNEDADVTTTTVPGGRLAGKNLAVWREGRIPFRDGNREYNGVSLGWNRSHEKASYSITLPPGFATAQTVLTLSIAAQEDDDAEPDEKPGTTDFTVAMESNDGAVARLPLSRFGILLPPIKVRFMKLEPLDRKFYKSPSEPVFQSIRLPLRSFAAQNARFDITKLKTVRFEFDRTPSRVIVSEIGFSDSLQ